MIWYCGGNAGGARGQDSYVWPPSTPAKRAKSMERGEQWGSKGLGHIDSEDWEKDLNRDSPNNSELNLVQRGPMERPRQPQFRC